MVFHYPPELLQLLRDTIPLLCRSKPDVLVFFQGAGVPSALYVDIKKKVDTDPKGISKYKIAGDILERLNNEKDNHLGELREVVRRVTEFEDFSTCWENDQLKAKGLVAEVRRVVDVKDAFTRMRIERETEAAKTRASTEHIYSGGCVIGFSSSARTARVVRYFCKVIRVITRMSNMPYTCATVVVGPPS